MPQRYFGTGAIFWIWHSTRCSEEKIQVCRNGTHALSNVFRLFSVGNVEESIRSTPSFVHWVEFMYVLSLLMGMGLIADRSLFPLSMIPYPPYEAAEHAVLVAELVAHVRNSYGDADKTARLWPTISSCCSRIISRMITSCDALSESAMSGASCTRHCR